MDGLRLPTLLVAAFCSTVACAASYTMVREGRPTATIVLAEQPTRAAQFAAAELQYYVKLSSGATLPVVTGGERATGLRLLVGDSPTCRSSGVSPEGLKPYEYVVTCRKSAVVMLGRDKPDTTKMGYSDHGTYPDFSDEHGTCAAVLGTEVMHIIRD